jgi:hypothetical protein
MRLGIIILGPSEYRAILIIEKTRLGLGLGLGLLPKMEHPLYLLIFAVRVPAV